MSTRPLRFLLVAVLSAVSLIGSASVLADPGIATAPDTPALEPTAITLSASAASTTFEKQVLTQINKARASKRKCGAKTYAKAKALKQNAKLAKAAEKHSVDMVARNYFSHTSKNGKSPGKRVKATGYKYKAMGETLTAGYATPKAAVKALLKSPAHCKIVMSKSYTQVGVGYHSGPSKYTHYLTVDFAKPKK